MAQFFENPANGYREKVGHAWLWTLLFGCFYFAYKGIWRHFVIAFFVAILTAGISWLIYPFFASRIIQRNYLQKGWKRTLPQAGEIY